MVLARKIIALILAVFTTFVNPVMPAAFAEVIDSDTLLITKDQSGIDFENSPELSLSSQTEKSDLIVSSSILSLQNRDSRATAPHPRLPITVRALEKKDFKVDDDVIISVNNPDEEVLQTQIVDANGDEAPIEAEQTTESDTTEIILTPTNQFKPGKFTIYIIDSVGQTAAQDFTWGVLALNPDRSVYKPNEKALIAIAVLNDKGDMVCDAGVTLTVKSPTSQTTELSTANDKIKVNEECKSHNFTLKPDYETSYTPIETGEYQLTLRADTKNGTRTINDTFTVVENREFGVKRTSATRIYPPNIYPMHLEITADRDFIGTVTETVPESFTITSTDQIEGAAPASNGSGTTYSAMNTIYKESQKNPELKLESTVLGASTSSLTKPFEGNYQISQGFGSDLTDVSLRNFYTHYGLGGHDGIDFALPIGTPLYAVDDGNIVLAGDGDYGTTVVIQHTWGRSYYGHLSKTSVEAGFGTKKGSMIGYSGNTGESTGPHLHFGMKPNEPDMNNGYAGKVNPLLYLPITSETVQLTNTESPTESKVLGLQTSSATREFIVAEKEIAKLAADDYGTRTEKAKVISWNVNLKKGESTTLTYYYKTPQVSPQFYTLGPVKFFESGSPSNTVFDEGRSWQIAADAVGTDWYNRNWQYRKPITVDRTKVITTPAWVQSKVQSGTGVTLDVALNSSVTAANLLVAVITYQLSSANANPSSLTDTQGNTWTAIGSKLGPYGTGFGQDNFYTEMFYAYNVNGGSTTVTTTFPANPVFASVAVSEYSGILSSSDPLDKTSGTTDTSADTLADSGSTAATSQAVELLVGGMGNNRITNGGTITALQSFDLMEWVTECFLASCIGLSQKVVTQTGAYSATYTVDSTEQGTRIATFKASQSSLTNYPVLINLTTDTNLASKAQSDADDILFTDSTGTTKLSHEIESYNSGTGALAAWVKIPSLSSSSDTEIYMYYGNAAASSQQDATNTWDSNYKGVWHMEETTGTTLDDSTTNNNNGTKVGATEPNPISGKISGGQDFDGSNDNSNHGSNSSLSTTGAFTTSIWVNWDALPHGPAFRDYIVERGENGTTNKNYYFWLDGLGTICGTGVETFVYGYRTTGGTYNDHCYSFTPTTGTFYKFDVVYDGLFIKLYKDGILVDSERETAVPQTAGTQNYVIGINSDGLLPINAVMDEARQSNTYRSSGWILTENNNQDSPSTFYSLGSEETKIYAPTNEELMRGGKYFDSSGVKQPFVF